jgi:pimeloyl-ACP methyl ester carboxylesterase
MANGSVLFVHGSFFSGWCWMPVIQHLSERHVSCRTVELPFTSLNDDVEHLRGEIARATKDGPVTVVAHSYTGITLSLAGHDAQHLVHVAARMPALGESQAALNATWGNPDFRSCMIVDDSGALNLTDEAFGFLFHRSDPNLARVAMAYRRPMRSEIPVEPLDNPAWLSVPSSYLVCSDDRAVNVEQQRTRAGWAKHSLEIDCDHSPFFSAPRETAAFIADTHEAVTR